MPEAVLASGHDRVQRLNDTECVLEVHIIVGFLLEFFPTLINPCSS